MKPSGLRIAELERYTIQDHDRHGVMHMVYDTTGGATCDCVDVVFSQLRLAAVRRQTVRRDVEITDEMLQNMLESPQSPDDDYPWTPQQ